LLLSATASTAVDIALTGGNGTAGVSGAAGSPDSLEFASDITVGTITLRGGAGGGAGSSAGRGGTGGYASLKVTGDIMSDTLTMTGGNGGSASYGGTGGYASLEADNVIVNGALALTGGNGVAGGYGGSGNYAWLEASTVTANTLTLTGGAGGQGNSSAGAGGSGSYARLTADIVATDTLTLRGGNGGPGTYSSAGSGSYAWLTVTDDITANALTLTGGNGGTSNGPSQSGGAGGYARLEAGTITANTLTLTGGNGNSGSSGTSGAGGYARLAARDITSGDITLKGGTGVGSSSGGSGGYALLEATCTITATGALTLTGGNGGARGNGGNAILDASGQTLTVTGTLHMFNGAKGANSNGGDVSLIAGILKAWTIALTRTTNDGGALNFNVATLEIDGSDDTTLTVNDLTASDHANIDTLLLIGDKNFILSGNSATDVTIGQLKIDAGILHAINWSNLIDDIAYTAQEILLGSGGATVDLGISDNKTLSRVLTGVGGLTKTNSGVLTLTGSNDYSGGTTISDGTLQIGDGGATGYVTGNIVDNAALIFNRSGELTYGDTISGSGSMTKLGTGKLTLTGVNTYTGDTTVSDGTLAIVGRGQIDSSNNSSSVYTQTAAATLDIMLNTSRVDDAYIVAGFAILDTGATLNISGISSDFVPSNAAAFDPAQYLLIHTANGISADFSRVTIGYESPFVDYAVFTTARSADEKDYSAGIMLRWFSPESTAHGTFTLNDAASEFTVGVPLTDQDGTFTSGWDGQSLTKAGDGTLFLTKNNTYTGVTTISNGTLQLGNGGTSGSVLGPIFVDSDGTLIFNRSDALTLTGALSGSGNVIQSGAGTTTLSGDFSGYSGSYSPDAGILKLVKSGALPFTLLFNNVLGLGTPFGTLGTLAFDLGGNTLSFGDNVGDDFVGTIDLTNAKLDLNGANINTVLNNNGTSGSVGASGPTLRLSSGSEADLLSGDAFIYALRFNGGMLNLSAFDNVTNVDNLTVHTLDSAGTSSTVKIDFSKISRIDTTVSEHTSFFDYVDDPGNYQAYLVEADTVASGVGQQLKLIDFDPNGDGTSTKQVIRYIDGDSPDNAAGAAIFDYVAMIDGNGVDKDGLCLGFGLKAIESYLGKTVTLDRSSATTSTPLLNAQLTGAGSFMFIGSGTETASAGNAGSDYSGATIVNGLALTAISNNVFGKTSSLSLVNNAAVDFQGNNQTVGALNGDVGTSLILGSGSVLSVGVAGDTLSNGHDGYDGHGVFEGTISGAGSLIKSGSGVLILSGNNTYTGNTTIEAGELRITGVLGALGNTVADGGYYAGAITIANNATLNLATSGSNGLDQYFASLDNDGTIILNNAANFNNGIGSKTLQTETLSGNGDIQMYVNIFEHIGDLIVAGIATGTHNLLLTNQGALPTGSEAPLLVAQTGAGSTAVFTSNRLFAGAFEYWLIQDECSVGTGVCWVLDHRYNPVYIDTQRINAETGFLQLANLHQRVDDHRHLTTELQSWARTYYNQGAEDGKRGFGYAQNTTGIQIGHEVLVKSTGENGTLRAALAFDTACTDADFNDRARSGRDTGSTKAKSYALGGYLTHTTADGAYLDFVGHAAKLENPIADDTTRDKTTQKGWRVGLSLEGGAPLWKIDTAWLLEGQAQLGYQYTKYQSFKDNTSKVGKYDAETLRGRLGARLVHELKTAENKPLKLYGLVNVHRDFFKPESVASVNLSNGSSTRVSERYGKSWGELGIGIQGWTNKSTSVFGDLRYQHGFSSPDKGDAREGGSVNIGARFSF
jgi:autotransporter family porin